MNFILSLETSEQKEKNANSLFIRTIFFTAATSLRFKEKIVCQD